MTASGGAETFVFQRDRATCGRMALRPLRDPDDLPTVHDWVTRPYARFWGMTGHTLEQVAAGYRAIMRNAKVFLGYVDGAPAFLVETYDPARDPIGKRYRLQAGDRGMHILVAPPERPRRGFTDGVFAFVMDFVFDDPGVTRVIVEPDVRNAKIHALNRRAGFRYGDLVDLPHKTAHLAYCTREQHHEGRIDPPKVRASADARLIEHLTPTTWEAVNRAMARKCIAELSHERLLEPRPEGHLPSSAETWSTYRLAADASGVTYHFQARVLPLNHWDLDASQIERRVQGETTPLAVEDFILDFAETLGLATDRLSSYLEEVLSTLYAAAYKHHHERAMAPDLVHGAFQELEAAMTEGHPSFIANSGRIGYDAADHAAFAPEIGAPVQLVWLAARKRLCEAATVEEDGGFDALVARELGVRQHALFIEALVGQKLDPSDYRLIPVHPWQWFNKLTTFFAPDLAARDLVCLGFGADVYHPQQSVRTFFNVSTSGRCYIKTAISVVNMGFMRGLSADYMASTPAICAWVDALVRTDSTLQAKGFSILREIAGVGYHSPLLESAVPKGSPYRKMLAALWRESPQARLAPGERLMTIAGLLHRDGGGRALLPLLIQASGLSIDDWLDRYLDCYLVPLVHCLQRHDLAFMPHGENVILVLDGHVPVRVIMKDIAEEVAVMNRAAADAMPEGARRICVEVPDAIKPLSIFTDVFEGIFRYLAQILLEQGDYPPARFWSRVGACIDAYNRAQAEQGHRIRHDLFACEFPLSCLNRLQLANNRHMLDLSDPAGGLKLAGMLRNPIARP